MDIDQNMAQEILMQWLRKHCILPTGKAITIACEVLAEIEPYAVSHVKNRLLKANQTKIETSGH